MDKGKKQYLDSLWKDTRVWKYIFLLAHNRPKEAKQLFEIVPEKYKGTAVEGNMFCYETNECCERLVKEFSNWEEYIEYVKTFDESVINFLYRLDLFDSFMARNLKKL